MFLKQVDAVVDLSILFSELIRPRLLAHFDVVLPIRFLAHPVHDRIVVGVFSFVTSGASRFKEILERERFFLIIG